MKVSELKSIIHLLPPDTEVTIGEPPKIKTSTLKREEWGNHDGRYNMRCSACGWVSDDIPRNQIPPTFCPKCGN